MQLAPIIQQALLPETGELDLAHARQLGGLLLRPADVSDLGAGDAGIEATALLSVSTQQVTWMPSSVHQATAPPGNRRPEWEVDLVVSRNRVGRSAPVNFVVSFPRSA